VTSSLSKVDGSGAMFDRIAQRYDLLNRLMSMGLDRSWRRQLIAGMPSNGDVLDIATGTADVALSIAHARTGAHVTGLDPSAGMLAVGQAKIMRAQLEDRVLLVEGDAQALPFEDDHFAGVTIAFGIRNVPDRMQALREMARVTCSGGPIAILELSEPEGGILAPFARFHVHHVVPWMGWLLSGHREYRYLQASIEAFPPAAEFADRMRSAGLVDVEVTRLTLGTAHLYVGRAP